jgi:hypothetical protein
MNIATDFTDRTDLNGFFTALLIFKSVPIRFIRVIGVPISQVANRQQSFIFKSE